MINVPSAYLYEDGEVVIQSQYLESGYLHYDNDDSFIITTASITYLPFMEITAGTSINIQSAKENRQALGDRMFNIRIQVLQANKNLPAITIGAQDILSVLGAQHGAKTTYYNSLYAVVSKKYIFGTQKILLSTGFGQPVGSTARFSQLKGFFGGVEWKLIKWLQVQAEYDARRFNCGIIFIPHKSILLKITTAQFEAFSIGLGLQFLLF